MPEDLNVLVEPYEEPPFPFDRFRDVIMRDERVHELLGELREPIISEPEVLGREKDQRSPFRATVFDQITNRAVEVRGRLDDLEQLDVRPSAFRPNPTADELQLAAEVVRSDPGFERLARSDDAVLYQPMPPLADLELDDGTSVRRPTVGIFDPKGSPRHQIVAVDLGQRVVDWTPHGVDGPTDEDCESHIPDRLDSAPDLSGPDKVRVRVIRNGEELWNFIVVRPRASTPTTYGKGSGVELRFVRYKGRLVMWKAHVPILNVLYDDGTSYRDWQNAETKFQAEGSDPVGPGFRVCTSPPATILEAGTDAGNFQGVALWYEHGELRIVSELQAGWYRYISDWRLRDDGVIKPRFGFAATKNARTCLVHQHHAYWRLDFDIEGAGNDVVQQTGRVLPGRPRWTNIVREAARKRSVFTSWRVVDKGTGRGYRIFPGLADGSANAFGVADLWFLRYHGDELDDGVSVVQAPAAQTQIQIGKYVNGESIDGTDLVVWYAGHFLHDENHPSPATGHIVGPELRPVNWS